MKKDKMNSVIAMEYALSEYQLVDLTNLVLFEEKGVISEY